MAVYDLNYSGQKLNIEGHFIQYEYQYQCNTIRVTIGLMKNRIIYCGFNVYRSKEVH